MTAPDGKRTLDRFSVGVCSSRRCWAARGRVAPAVVEVTVDGHLAVKLVGVGHLSEIRSRWAARQGDPEVILGSGCHLNATESTFRLGC